MYPDHLITVAWLLPLPGLILCPCPRLFFEPVRISAKGREFMGDQDKK